MILDIAQLGQPVLRRFAEPVSAAELTTPTFQQLVDDMLETVMAQRGAGLAGPQVFQSKRLFVASVVPREDDEQPLPMTVVINPSLTALSAERPLAWEGCLSFIELLVLVPRWEKVRLEFLDRQGQPQLLELEGWPARVVQHEYDHLDGVLTLERAPTTRYIIKTSEVKAALEDLKKQGDREKEA